MLAIFLGALVLGGGVLLVQLAVGHHAGDHDASASTDHEASTWSILGSLRFWSFALFGFGLVGALTLYFGFATELHASIVAAVFGLATGAAAVTLLRRLTHKGPSSHAAVGDVVGHVGRVLVPPNEAGRAKIRVAIKGATVDYVATTSEALDEGDAVLVESQDGALVRVSRAPREIA